MSDHEDTSIDTGFSTPVPELDDHTRRRSSAVAGARSRRGTAGTIHSVHAGTGFNPDLSLVDAELLRTKARDFGDFGDNEEAVQDDEPAGPSQHGRHTSTRSRRGTAATIDLRSGSPPSSVKAFAGARRRERKFSVDDENQLHRTVSGGSIRSYRSRRSRLTRQRTNDPDSNSIASSKNSAEDDVCFPYDSGNNEGLQIDFEGLEDFIADEEEREEREKAPTKTQIPRVFTDLRAPTNEATPTFTADGDYLSNGSSLPLNEKPVEERHEVVKQAPKFNKFEFFSSASETTIHAADFGDLILPGEDIRSLFTLPAKEDGAEEDGVWWLNMNSPSEEEIRAICKSFGVHPLTIEDIYTQEAREKIEIFPSYYFACFRSFQVVQEEGGGHDYEPVMIFVIVFGEGTLSFSFAENNHAATVRERITKLKDYMSLSSDWICYALIDAIVDSFAPVIHDIEQQADQIEDEVFVARSDDMHFFLRKIGMTRRNVMGLMRLLGGKADVLRGFTKRCNANFKSTPRMDIGLYLGDIQDHVVTMMTNLGHFEKMLSRSHSNYLAQLSIDNIVQGNRSNKVLSKITVVASILVPLNLICGLFGMNVKVPFQSNTNTELWPFFTIVAVIVAFVTVSIACARRYKYI